MKVNDIELEVGQEWRTKENSKFYGTRVIIVKVEGAIVKGVINNMLFNESIEHIVEESDLSYLMSIGVPYEPIE
jgi:hypothetical protein